MSGRIDDGGPAFPSNRRKPRPDWDYEPGMTLRDYFAAQAMQGELASMQDPKGEICGIALDASDDALHRLTKHWYRLADAMLLARGQS